MSEVAVFGPWLDGQLDARNIQTRELAQVCGIHESEISRIRNSRKPADDKQKFQIGYGVARLEMQRAKK